MLVIYVKSDIDNNLLRSDWMLTVYCKLYTFIYSLFSIFQLFTNSL